MTADTLPLTGARKKPEPKPRTEGLVQIGGRRCYYVRLYGPGAKRATYRSTGRPDVASAEQLIPHLRAALLRAARPTPPPNATQPCLI